MTESIKSVESGVNASYGIKDAHENIENIEVQDVIHDNLYDEPVEEKVEMYDKMVTN